MEIFIGILIILIAHFVADFMLQTHYMASQKSENVWILVQHIITYTLAFFIIFGSSWYLFYYFFEPITTADIWLKLTIGISLVNGILHYLIDFFTSKVTKYLWRKKAYHNFFVVIGFDQLLHTGLLIFSYMQMLQNFGHI